MYQGNIPYDRKTDNPMYYPQNGYEWEFNGKIYASWMEIERQWGKLAVKKAVRLDVPPNWKPNAPFKARMQLVSYSRGRSAANFNVEDEHGRKYTIFLTDMVDILQKCGIVKGWTEELIWSFGKRGQNYGVRLHDE
jgi:hypothetical protein